MTIVLRRGLKGGIGRWIGGGLALLVALGSGGPGLAWTPLKVTPWPAWTAWREPWRGWAGAPDPQAQEIVAEYVAQLGGAGAIATHQGVWFQAGLGAIATHQGQTPLPAASLTKMATTLAALKTWPPDHQFATALRAQGAVVAGVLQGDLIVQAEGDPFFVWEEAIALGHGLAQAGIQRVTGNLVIEGPFTMNFQPDPAQAGALLRQGFNQALWPPSAQQQYASLPTPLPPPQIPIEGTVLVHTGPSLGGTPLVTRRSLPLVALLKAMNIYSNNAMAESLGRLVGGAGAIAQSAATATGLPLAEMQLINGSGLGVENQISPRAAVAMLRAIQQQLAPHGLTVADVMPVAGEDVGTLQGRQLPAQSALKTGSLSVVSALSGVMPTRDRGLVWFAIINGGSSLDTFRDRQDTLLARLQSHWGATAAPPTLQPRVRLGQAPYQLGDPSRTVRE